MIQSTRTLRKEVSDMTKVAKTKVSDDKKTLKFSSVEVEK